MDNPSLKSCVVLCMLFGFTAWPCNAGSASPEPETIAGEAFSAGSEPRVDNPVDAWMTAHRGPAGRAVGGNYKRRYEILDATDSRAGDFSITFRVDRRDRQTAFGFTAGPYLDHWALNRDFSLSLWLKAEADTEPEEWTVALYDTSGNRASLTLSGLVADGEWRQFDLRLGAIEGAGDFSFGETRSVQLEAALPEGARLWFDDVHFHDGDKVLGVTDKTITQYMAEAEATRARRVDEGLAGRAGDPARHFVPRLWNGEDLEKTNRQILEYIEDEKSAVRPWGLWTSSALHWMYFGFSSEGRLKPGRLTEEAEAALLDWMWERTRLKNDIATTRRSTWYVAGSENHDINAKSANLLSSQIFMHEREFADRTYPNLGRMIGYKYGMNPEFLPEGAKPVLKLGSGNLSDGKEYGPENHYRAWVSFWKEYFAERVRHGFFIENNATGYMSHTGRFLHDIYAWVEDETLRRQSRMFLDLMWAQWMQDQLLTLQGGSATRGGPGQGRMGLMAEYFLGGPVAGVGYFYMFSDYQWPRALWEMMLDRRGKGEFAYISRKPNEEQVVEPRPAGTEYSMLIRPDSRLVRYSWVTPDYVMGVRMDHPNAVYCHLSTSGQGIVFPTTPGATIRLSPGWSRAVQHQNVVALQPKSASELTTRSPPWFPGNKGFTDGPIEPVRVSFGTDIDRIEEKDGWVFVEEGNAFAAFRIVWPESLTPVEYDEEGFGLLKAERKAYAWNEDRTQMTARQTDAALIIETSRRAHHPTLEAFQKDILSNPLQLKLVIRGFVLTYRGSGDDAPEIFLNCANAETPKIDGEYISYDAPTFESPYLQAGFGSGVVTLTAPISGKTRILDFNGVESRVKP